MALLVKVLVSATLVAMMLRIGFDVAFDEVVATARNKHLVARALLANYILVPAVTIALLLALHVQPLVSVAFLILSVCPGAPFSPPLTAIAKGAVEVSVGLMMILAGSSAVLAPLLLRLLLPFFSGNASLHVNVLRMLGTLLITQFLPLSIGLAVRFWRPNVAAKLKKPFDTIATVLLLVTLLSVLTVHYRVLLDIRLIGFAAMLGVSIASLAIGWFAGGPDLGSRKATALTTSFRNAGVGMVIAAASFAGTIVLSAIVAYTLISTVGTVAPALWWGRVPAD